jgi:membrane protein insertase Oxa1/YidC/SpoIIIJ
LYWLTNNLVSMVVQLWVNKIVNKEESVVKI